MQPADRFASRCEEIASRFDRKRPLLALRQSALPAVQAADSRRYRDAGGQSGLDQKSCDFLCFVR